MRKLSKLVMNYYNFIKQIKELAQDHEVNCSRFSGLKLMINVKKLVFTQSYRKYREIEFL